MEKRRKAMFEPYTNQILTIRPSDEIAIPVKLASITTRHVSDHYESFAMTFDPPEEAVALPDDSY